MLLAFVMQPLYGRMKPRLGAGWAAVTVVVGATLALAGGVLALVWLFVTKGVSLARELIALLYFC
jgi:predicted PurR-regulated permease PerM